MLAIRVQQVGQVGMLRRHPMLVSELPAEVGGPIRGTAPVGHHGPVRFGPGHASRVGAGDQFGHHGQMRRGEVPVAQPVVYVGKLVLDRRQRGRVVLAAAGDGRGGLELRQRLPVPAEHDQRRLTGPVQGFGKMWQKTYRMDAGPRIQPQQAIATWREHFPEFWPKGNRFAGALTGINPGDVALLDLAIGGGVKLSTGVFVLYADAESFTLMTPQGHMFAGRITIYASARAIAPPCRRRC